MLNVPEASLLVGDVLLVSLSWPLGAQGALRELLCCLVSRWMPAKVISGFVAEDLGVHTS